MKTTENINLFYKQICKNYPAIIEQIRSELSPQLTDFCLIPAIIYMVEIEENINEYGYFFLDFREVIEFEILVIAVIIALYDKAFFTIEKKLIPGLIKQMEKIFKRSNITIYARIKIIKQAINEDPFFNRRVFNLANKFVNSKYSNKEI